MKYRSGYKYQLAEDEIFETVLRPAHRIETPFIDLTTDGEMAVRASYAWDGPSGPTWDTASSMRGSLFHDAAYQLLRMEQLPQGMRRLIDTEMGRFCVDDGMWGWRAKLWVRELRFATAAADPKNRKKVHTAP
jgi:hypothetical protein